MTPGAPYTPQTPGMFMDHGMADWHTTEIEVKIKETHDDTNLIFQKGQIRSVSVSHIPEKKNQLCPHNLLRSLFIEMCFALNILFTRTVFSIRVIITDLFVLNKRFRFFY